MQFMQHVLFLYSIRRRYFTNVLCS